jgi:O-antigen ligase
MYAVLFALFALWPLDGRSVAILLGALGLGIAGVGLVELLRTDAAAHPEAFFIDVRLAEPAGYMNANAALWTIGLLACVFLAAHRPAPALLRGVALGGAGLLAGLALLAQSRGWALALPCALVVFLLLHPSRVRLLAAIGAVGVAALAIREPLLAVHDEYAPAALDGLVSDAAGAVLLAAAVLCVLGFLAALADRRVDLPPRARRAVNVGVAALVVAGVVAGVALYSAREGSPATGIADAWDDFKQGGAGPQAGGTRFAGGGTNRYDFWTVAWNAFEDEPLKGLGVENFQEEYLRLGTSGEQPRYAHSLELGVLSQTGLPGALLLFGGLAAAVVAALLGTRALPRAARTATAAGLALFAYWLLHASVDWFWEFPALTGVAVAALGATCALVPRGSGRPRRRRLALGIAGVLAAVALAASFALPWLADLQVHRATTIWRTNPDAAFSRLDHATDLNPLGANAPLTAGTIALRLDRPELARQEFALALDREPRSAYALLELGAIASTRGDRDSARAFIGRAARLSPRDSLIDAALRRVRRGRRIDIQALNRAILERAEGRGSRAR